MMMRDVFVISLRYGAQPTVTFERDHDAAGWASEGQWVGFLPEQRGAKVVRVVYDIVGGATYAYVEGILYDDAEDYARDLEFLRDAEWEEVTPA